LVVQTDRKDGSIGNFAGFGSIPSFVPRGECGHISDLRQTLLRGSVLAESLMPSPGKGLHGIGAQFSISHVTSFLKKKEKKDIRPTHMHMCLPTHFS
jgi:hypothetical protein